jgi:hypothetical protein
MEHLEQDIYDIWSNFDPVVAFQCGNDEKVGEFFIPTEENILEILRKIDGLKLETIDSVNLGVLNCLETQLKLEEPYKVLWRGIWAYFTYLTKEGIHEAHLTELTKKISLAIKYTNERLNNKNWSIEIKIVTMNNYFGLLGVIDSIEKEKSNLRSIFNELRDELKKYMKKYQVQGIKNGDFSEVFPILEEKGGKIGRAEIYPKILKNIWGYLETPYEIESMALSWLNEERPQLNKITKKLADYLKVEADIEKVSEELVKINKVKKDSILDFINKLRKPLREVVEENIVEITPKYETKVMETPKYLLNLISTAAMRPFDIHAENPFNIFFVTTDENRSPPTNISDILQLIIHEEFGHCVHFSNSGTKFRANISKVDMIYTELALPISDGISFYREWEVLQLFNRIISKPEVHLNDKEKRLLNMLQECSDLELLNMELEFTIYRWRIIRFLRAIGDVRINMHKQSLVEFITWASEYTGLSKKFIFDQIFLFQARPGYAPCYSIAGNRIQELQAKAKERGRSEIDFNSYASSLGFPPRVVFEQKLNDF